jgi:hypothetical protein
MGAKQFTAQTHSADAALREIVEGVESETGDRFSTRSSDTSHQH